MGYPTITYKSVRKIKAIKKAQKANKVHYTRLRTRNPKMKITKIVENAGVKDLSSNKTVFQFQTEELLSRIQEAELTGLSGNGFSTYKKLKCVIECSAQEKILIVNGAECDPGLIHDEWLLFNKFSDIVEGAKKIKELINAKQVILAVKRKDLPATREIEVKILPNRYPIGAEKILIKNVLDRDFDKKEIPATKGILVMNVQTVASIAQIVRGDYQKGSRYITVADYSVGEAKVVKIDYGMKADDVLIALLGKRNKKKYIGGGVMNVKEMKESDALTPTTNVIAYAEPVSFDNNSRCKKCKYCTKKCPMGIEVHKVVQVYDNKLKVDMKQFNVQDCINCGTCSFNCAAGKNTMEIVNMYK